ncbi:MAG TPA: hypothetical protein VM848_10365 [Acidimicrobiia bacterium]|nr:hypothetical protein [Acidimicrobiia bacterium]
MPSISTTQHEQLLSIVLDHLGRDNVEVLEGGWAVRDRRGGVYGLVNLAQELAAIPESEWIERIGERLAMLGAISPEFPADYEQAGPNLRVRLSADGSEPGWAAYRRICDGLDEVLMMRNDVGCITVSPAQIESWGVSPDRAFKDARQQTIWDEPRERRILARGDSKIVWVRANFFASSVLLALDHLLSRKNLFGAVAMAPCRDALIYTEVSDERITASVAGMIEIGGQWFVDGPGSISPEVFWYQRDGTISRLVKAVGCEFVPCWGPDFSDVLAQLGAPAPSRHPKKRR